MAGKATIRSLALLAKFGHRGQKRSSEPPQVIYANR